MSRYAKIDLLDLVETIDVGMILQSEQLGALYNALLNCDFEEEALLKELKKNKKLRLAYKLMYEFTLDQMPLLISTEGLIVETIVQWRLRIAK